MKNIEQIKTFIRLRSSGHSLREIAKILNKSVNTVFLWDKKYCSVVFEVQSEELKEFKQKLLDEKKSRLDYLNSHFIKIRESLENSDIMLRYDKMLFLLMKLSKSIDECQSTIVLSEIAKAVDDIDVINTTEQNSNIQLENSNTLNTKMIKKKGSNPENLQKINK